MPLPSFLQFAGTPATGYAKADLGKRFGAAAIDSGIAWIAALLLATVGAVFGARMAFYGIGLLLGAVYVLVRDGLGYAFMDRRSIGKKLLKLRPVRLDGGAVDRGASIRRNATLAAGGAALGLSYLMGGLELFFLAGLFWYLSWLTGLLGLAEAVLVIVDKDGRRIGDRQANTQVIESEA